MKFTDEERKIVENDVQHINTMKMNIARKKRNGELAMIVIWSALAFGAHSMNLRVLTIGFAIFGLISLFQMNAAWKELIKLEEKIDE